ncbi:MAG TPA: NAD(P)H-dependent oxidoreductase [Acetobacteraceae bacterium]|nr:NAD(P)H-dependent oxidoreductase [Acetobacteraceae bacterium]
MDAFRILAISGSLRRGSYNTAALRVAQEVAPDGVEIEIADISQIPIYNEDVKAAGLPAMVEALCARIAAADAVLISTPEYNYSVPGVLKNTIDWISRAPKQPFDGKPIAIMGASPGAIGTARAQYDLRKTFVFLNGHVLNRPEVMISAAATRFDAEGRLTDEATRGFIRTLVQALRDWAMRLHG